MRSGGATGQADLTNDLSVRRSPTDLDAVSADADGNKCGGTCLKQSQLQSHRSHRRWFRSPCRATSSERATPRGLRCPARCGDEGFRQPHDASRNGWCNPQKLQSESVPHSSYPLVQVLLLSDKPPAAGNETAQSNPRACNGPRPPISSSRKAEKPSIARRPFQTSELLLQPHSHFSWG